MARSRKQNALSSLFDEADSPIYMLDTDRRLQYCNQACCDWTECSSDQLQGVRWDYHTLESDPPPIAAIVDAPSTALRLDEAESIIEDGRDDDDDEA